MVGYGSLYTALYSIYFPGIALDNEHDTLSPQLISFGTDIISMFSHRECIKFFKFFGEKFYSSAIYNIIVASAPAERCRSKKLDHVICLQRTE